MVVSARGVAGGGRQRQCQPGYLELADGSTPRGSPGEEPSRPPLPQPDRLPWLALQAETDEE